MDNKYLPSSTDGELVKSVQGDSPTSEPLRELIARHSGIYINIINSYFSRGYPSQAKRELMDDKDYNIYMAALKYNPCKGTKFSTHLGNEAKWICLNYFNKNKNKSRKEQEYKDELEAPTEEVPLGTAIEREDLIRRITELIASHPDPRVKEIFNLRYCIGEGNKVMAWERVGQQIGISIQGCINIHNKAIRNLQAQLREKSDA